jgi:hypothetical protein
MLGLLEYTGRRLGLLEGELLGEIRGRRKPKQTDHSLVYTRARLAPAWE